MLAAIELETSFSGVNDLWVTSNQGATGVVIPDQGASIMKSTTALMVSEANVLSQTTRTELPPGVTEAKIASLGQTDPRTRRGRRPVELQPVETAILVKGVSVTPAETTILVLGASATGVVDNTLTTGKAITYGEARQRTVRTVTMVRVNQK